MLLTFPRIFSVTAAVAALALVTPVSPATAPADQLIATSSSTTRLNTADQAAVNAAYWALFAPNAQVAPQWSGANSGCKAGRPTARFHSAVLSMTNFVRKLGRLDPVRFSDTLSWRAQKAALIMSANRRLDHDPDPSMKCWTRTGAYAAGRSNLALDPYRLNSGTVVRMYMTDPGSGNTAAGHRRWMMNPFATTMGSGTTSSTNALWVLGPMDTTRANPSWVSWPTAGWFPNPLEPSGRWSLSAGSSRIDFSRAHVHVRDAAGTAISVGVYRVVSGYGRPTIVWRVSGVSGTGTYQVTVSNIKRKGRTGSISHSYTVHLFTPAQPVPVM